MAMVINRVSKCELSQMSINSNMMSWHINAIKTIKIVCFEKTSMGSFIRSIQHDLSSVQFQWLGKIHLAWQWQKSNIDDHLFSLSNCCWLRRCSCYKRSVSLFALDQASDQELHDIKPYMHFKWKVLTGCKRPDELQLQLYQCCDFYSMQCCQKKVILKYSTRAFAMHLQT